MPTTTTAAPSDPSQPPTPRFPLLYELALAPLERLNPALDYQTTRCQNPAHEVSSLFFTKTAPQARGPTGAKDLEPLEAPLIHRKRSRPKRPRLGAPNLFGSL